MSYDTLELQEILEDERSISYGVVQPGSVVENGTPIVRVNNLKDNRMNYDDVLTIDPQIEEKYQRTRLRGGEILLSLVGTVGRCIIAPKELEGWNVARAIGVIPVKKSIDPRWVLYALQSSTIRQYMNERLNTTVQATFNLKDVTKIMIPFPSPQKRETIIAILSSLDDKVENNRKTCEKLEEIAQAIFKRWFMDFEFPNEEGLPYKSSGGEMVVCEELGKEIPKGWKIRTINHCCEKIFNGGTPKRNIEEYWNANEIPWLTSGEVRENIIIKTSNYISKQGFNDSSAKWAPALATVVALYGATAGQVALLALNTTTNQAVCSLIAKKHYKFFNYLVLSLSVKELFNKAVGSAQQNISKAIVGNYQTIIPSENTLKLFDTITGTLFSKIILGKQQSDLLQQVRDSLLPKLMSGELAVEEGEVG